MTQPFFFAKIAAWEMLFLFDDLDRQSYANPYAIVVDKSQENRRAELRTVASMEGVRAPSSLACTSIWCTSGRQRSWG